MCTAMHIIPAQNVFLSLFLVDWTKKMFSKDTSLVITPTSYNIKKNRTVDTPLADKIIKIVFERLLAFGNFL